MKSWKVLIWALVTAVLFVLTTAAAFWALGTPVTSVATQAVDGVTVAQESQSDYTPLIVPGLFLAMTLVGLMGAGFALWRTAKSAH